MLWVAVTSVLVCNGDNRTAVVTDSAGLAQSLRDPHVDTVAIQGTGPRLSTTDPVEGCLPLTNVAIQLAFSC